MAAAPIAFLATGRLPPAFDAVFAAKEIRMLASPPQAANNRYGRLRAMLPQPARLNAMSRAITLNDYGRHLPNVKVGCQKLRGQKKIEMKY